MNWRALYLVNQRKNAFGQGRNQQSGFGWTTFTTIIFINDYLLLRTPGRSGPRVHLWFASTNSTSTSETATAIDKPRLARWPQTALWRLQISIFGGACPQTPLVGVAHTSFGLTSINLAIAPLFTSFNFGNIAPDPSSMLALILQAQKHNIKAQNALILAFCQITKFSPKFPARYTSVLVYHLSLAKGQVLLFASDFSVHINDTWSILQL